jgi:hypothetical protein
VKKVRTKLLLRGNMIFLLKISVYVEQWDQASNECPVLRHDKMIFNSVILFYSHFLILNLYLCGYERTRSIIFFKGHRCSNNTCVPGLGVIQSGEISAPGLAVETVAPDKGTTVRYN